MVDVADLSDPEVQALHLNGFFGVAGDGFERLYSPSYFDGKFVNELPEVTVDQIRSSECYDVISEDGKLENGWIEYVGCPEQDSIDDVAYRPITQQGTLAPVDWRDHVAPVHKAKPVTLSTENPLSKKK